MRKPWLASFMDRRSLLDKDGYRKDAEIISEAEEEHILTSGAKHLARKLVDPTK